MSALFATIRILSPVDVDRMATAVRGYAVARSLTPWEACNALSMPAEVRAVFAPARWTYEEADAASAWWSDGPLCNAFRRVNKDHAEMCSRTPGHEGDHVDGRAAWLRHEGRADGGAYTTPAGSGPWHERRPCALEHDWSQCTRDCR